MLIWMQLCPKCFLHKNCVQPITSKIPRLQFLSKNYETYTKTTGILLSNHRIKRNRNPSYEERAATLLVELCPKYEFCIIIQIIPIVHPINHWFLNFTIMLLTSSIRVLSESELGKRKGKFLGFEKGNK
jgi:hypothetical protein